MMTSPTIAILPQASRSILRSTTILTSLPQIVFELVQNSLDAGASQVDVGVDVDVWHCWVRDDGHGIEDTGMSILAKGGEEGRYGKLLFSNTSLHMFKIPKEHQRLTILHHWKMCPPSAFAARASYFMHYI